MKRSENEETCRAQGFEAGVFCAKNGRLDLNDFEKLAESERAMEIGGGAPTYGDDVKDLPCMDNVLDAELAGSDLKARSDFDYESFSDGFIRGSLSIWHEISAEVYDV